MRRLRLPVDLHHHNDESCEPLFLDIEKRTRSNVALAFGLLVELEHHQLVRYDCAGHLMRLAPTVPEVRAWKEKTEGKRFEAENRFQFDTLLWMRFFFRIFRKMVMFEFGDEWNGRV